MTNVAYLGIPPVGGLRTFLINLRDSLAPNGIRVSWLGSGRQEAQAAIARGIYDECPDGVVAAPEAEDDRARVKALMDYVRENQIPAVLLSSVAAATGAGLASCLPAEVKRIFIVYHPSPMTYRVSKAMRDYVDYTVAISPRIERDLIRYHGFDAARTAWIPHGIVPAPTDGERPKRNPGAPLRVVYVGRVEDGQKGVLWIPEILERAIAAGADVRLTVAGDGPDLDKLRNAVSRRGLGSRVQFMGKFPPDGLQPLLRSHDVLLLPSRLEGLSYVSLEAMAVGCVPVASRIHGVTDYVVQHGRTGFLFPVGSTRAAADHLARLAADPGLLRAAGAAAQADVKSRFSLAEQGERYAALIQDTIGTRHALRQPVALENWSVPRGFRPGWWHWLPLPIKNLLRCARERFLAGGGMQT
jgi:glycosyltransferase involved in cell wall biosynthesis